MTTKDDIALVDEMCRTYWGTGGTRKWEDCEDHFKEEMRGGMREVLQIVRATTPPADRQAALDEMVEASKSLTGVSVWFDKHSKTLRAALFEPALVEYIDANSLKLKPSTSGILHDDDNRAEEDRVYWYNAAIDKLSTQFHFVKKAGL